MHDNIVDFRLLITKIAKILPLSVVVADKGYDSEDNHTFVRESLHALVLYYLGIDMYQYGRHIKDTGNR
jgi:hypothetical protein